MGGHISQLIEQGRSYVLLDDGAGHLGNTQVAFKADVGSLWNSVAQITGVWTRPDLRGRGLAKVALGASAGPDLRPTPGQSDQLVC